MKIEPRAFNHIRIDAENGQYLEVFDFDNCFRIDYFSGKDTEKRTIRFQKEATKRK